MARTVTAIGVVTIAHFVACMSLLGLSGFEFLPSQGRADAGVALAASPIAYYALLLLLVPLGPFNGLLWGVLVNSWIKTAKR